VPMTALRGVPVSAEDADRGGARVIMVDGQST
jgi:hypothetical protein